MAKSTCKRTGKLSFKSEAQAANAMRYVIERDAYFAGEEMSTYKCSCGRWHFGHNWWKRLEEWQRMKKGVA